MAQLEDIQNMQGAVTSTPAVLMDMSVPGGAGVVNINPEWVCVRQVCEREVCKYFSGVYCLCDN